MMELLGDPIEAAQIAAALIAATFTSWALRRALRNSSYVQRPTEDQAILELRPAAARRVRQQSFLLLIQAVLIVAGFVSVARETLLVERMAVRGFTLAIVSLLLMLLSALNHWEQRSSDLKPWVPGDPERRKP